jgi:hypothetical protein
MMTQEALMQNPHATAIKRRSTTALLGTPLVLGIGLAAVAATGCSSGTPIAAAPATAMAAPGARRSPSTAGRASRR